MTSSVTLERRSMALNDLKEEDLLYRFPGQHLYEGVVYGGHSPATAIEAAKTATLDESDVIVATYPKSGTTWTQEIVWLLLNNFNFTGASSAYIEDRCLLLELIHPDPVKQQACLALKPPRVIKTHLYYTTLEKNLTRSNPPKVIVVLRNPKDVLVSFYNYYLFSKDLGCYKGTWDDFFELFKNNELASGVWKDHVCGWWKNRGKPNYFYLRYENMKKNPTETVSDLVRFLGVKATKADIDRLLQHTSFNKMKDNPMTNRGQWPSYDTTLGKFMRKGEVGDWKNYFSKEQSSYVDDICRELSQKDLVFDFE